MIEADPTTKYVSKSLYATSSRRPEARGGLNADNIGPAHLRQRGSERRIDPITGVGQNDAIRHTVSLRGADLIERDLRFGLENDVRGNASLAATPWILGPIFRQIKPKGDRQNCVIIGD